MCSQRLVRGEVSLCVDWTRPICSAVFSTPSPFDVFPLPHFLEIDCDSRALALLNATIAALNSLSAGAASHHVLPTTFSEIQRGVASTLLRTVQLMLDQPVSPQTIDSILSKQLPPQSLPVAPQLHGYTSFSALELVLNKGILDSQAHAPPTAESRGDWRTIDVTRVALPSEGAQVDILGVLPTDVAEQYSRPNDILLRMPPPLPQEVELVPLVFGVKKGHYPRLIRRLLDAGIISMQFVKPLCVNGLFAVRKDADSDRLIFDGRRANAFFLPPPSPNLPSPTDLADLVVPPHSTLYVGKSDIANMYHRLRVPEWLSTYLGLPSLPMCAVGTNTDLRIGWPVFRTLPMGFSHSVYLAHLLHGHVIHTTYFPLCQHLSPSHLWLDIGSPVYFTYIDDHGVLAVSLQEASDLLSRSVTALDSIGLNHHPKKLIPPSKELTSIELLGITVASNCVVYPEVSRLSLLVGWTLEALTHGVVQFQLLLRLVGSWIWLLLLRRPLLSAIDETFKFISTHQHHRGQITLPVVVKAELCRLVQVVPLLFVDLRAPEAMVVVATDACLTGGAVVQANVSEEEFRTATSYSIRRGWYSSLTQEPCYDQPLSSVPSASPFLESMIERANWTVVLSTRWKFEEKHIVILEGQALIFALRWIASQPHLLGSRIVFLLDSLSLLGAVAKGRSSSSRLNRICQKVSALILATAIRPLWVYVPTHINPADAPSRWL